MNTLSQDQANERRRNVRRSTILLSLVALAFYVGFIVMSVARS